MMLGSITNLVTKCKDKDIDKYVDKNEDKDAVVDKMGVELNETKDINREHKKANFVQIEWSLSYLFE